jgi:hypothetical protein
VYTYTKDEADVAIIVTQDELYWLRLIVAEAADRERNEIVRKQYSFYLSVLQGDVPDESWYDGTDEEEV